MFKKTIFAALAIIILVSPIYCRSFYYPVTPGLESAGSASLRATSGLGAQDPIDIASMVINWLLTILGLFFLILTIYGGIIWMLARGEESEVEKATNIIKAAVIGLIIIIASYGLSYFIFTVIVNISQGT